jgi:hypothetical protein
MKKFFYNFIHLYTDGFKNTRTGRKLLLIVVIKLIIIFAILKIFFFPDFLKSRFSSDTERSDYVIDQLTKTDNK